MQLAMDQSTTTTTTGTALQRTESFQYPQTHAGHLNESQSLALESFKALCEKNGYYRPGNESQKPSHDDQTLLRYLRARKFIPEDAFQQFKDTQVWRENNQIGQLYETIDVGAYEDSRRLYTHWTGRTDKRGIPLYIFEVAPLNSQRMASYEKSIEQFKRPGTISTKLLHLFALCENWHRFTMPLCSAVPSRPYPETPISQSSNIVDISSVGIRQFWNLRQHMQDASTLATAHYPETLDRIFIIGAPSFFPTVWSWIKAWFDPITVSKIFILNKTNTYSTLAQYIDPANIPRKYGGTFDWTFGDLPVLEPAINEILIWEKQNENGENSFPEGPIEWREDANGDMVAHAIGSIDGTQRDQIIARLPSRKLYQPNISAAISANDVAKPQPTSPAPDLEALATTGTHTHPGTTEQV